MLQNQKNNKMRVIIFFTSKYKLSKIGINNLLTSNNDYVELLCNNTPCKLILIGDNSDVTVFNNISISKDSNIVYVYHSETNKELKDYLNNSYTNSLSKTDFHEIVGNNKSKYYILLEHIKRYGYINNNIFNKIWNNLNSKSHFDDIKFFLMELNSKQLKKITLPLSLQEFEVEYNSFVKKVSTNNEEKEYVKAFIEFRDILIKDVYF